MNQLFHQLDPELRFLLSGRTALITYSTTVCTRRPHTHPLDLETVKCKPVVQGPAWRPRRPGNCHSLTWWGWNVDKSAASTSQSLYHSCPLGFTLAKSSRNWARTVHNGPLIKEYFIIYYRNTSWCKTRKKKTTTEHKEFFFSAQSWNICNSSSRDIYSAAAGFKSWQSRRRESVGAISSISLHLNL